MASNNLLNKISTLVQSLTASPLTFKKAVFLCLYVVGISFAANVLFILFNIPFGLLNDIVFLVLVLLITREMGKNELSRILAWRTVPVPVFAALLVMFFGMEIIKSELNNLLQNIIPIPEDFFDDWIYTPNNVFLVIVTGALFPGFSEEIFFRGIIARRFFRSYSIRKSILLSAALFGAVHLNPWQAMNAFYAGIFLGWMYWRYRSIWLCMLLHAYHNILADFMPFPYVKTGSSGYNDMWRHPLWFDMLGLLLFGLGLYTIIVLSQKRERIQIRK